MAPHFNQLIQWLRLFTLTWWTKKTMCHEDVSSWRSGRGYASLIRELLGKEGLDRSHHWFWQQLIVPLFGSFSILINPCLVCVCIFFRNLIRFQLSHSSLAMATEKRLENLKQPYRILTCGRLNQNVSGMQYAMNIWCFTFLCQHSYPAIPQQFSSIHLLCPGRTTGQRRLLDRIFGTILWAPPFGTGSGGWVRCLKCSYFENVRSWHTIMEWHQRKKTYYTDSIQIGFSATFLFQHMLSWIGCHVNKPPLFGSPSIPVTKPGCFGVD